MEQGDFGSQYETGMSSRGAAALRDFGRARGADIVQEGKLPTGAMLRWRFTEIGQLVPLARRTFGG